MDKEEKTVNKTDLTIEKAGFREMNQLLKPLGFSCRRIEDYDYTDERRKRKWIGVFVADEQNDVYEFPISVNLGAIKNSSGSIATFETEVFKTIAHECGHGFLAKLKDDEVSFKGRHKGEERLAEEFAQYIMGERHSSSISDALRDNDYGDIGQIPSFMWDV